MNAETMAEWYRRQGYQVFQAAGFYWYEHSPRVFQAFPDHWVKEPPDRELNSFLVRHMAIGLRYSTLLTASCGALSYHAVHQDGPYTMATLPGRARTAVRKGLRTLEVEPISLGRLAKEGWELRYQTSQRQGRTGEESVDWWMRLCLAAEGLSGFEAWGAFYEGRLAAALLAVTCDDCYILLFQQSATQYLHLGANNVLAYAVTNQVTKRPDINQVFYGTQAAQSEVDTFKFRMGYVAKPVRQRVLFHPLLAPAFNSLSHTMLKRLRTHQPDSKFLVSAERMVRFYLLGRKPLDQQSWEDLYEDPKG